MPSISIATLDRGTKDVDAAVFASFGSTFKGRILTPKDGAYNEARTVWNAMIDRHPAVIMQCTSAADVQQAVKFAREHHLLVAVKGGGHNIAGNAVCDGGLLIDLSPMKTVTIQKAEGIAHVGGGATLGEFDGAAQAHGLATPLGINSTTGVAGLTLGGGFGWLSRKYGMSIDNLVGAEVVLASGDIVNTNEKQNPDLFWALRGGGGNFGVVTRFDFKLHPVGPDVAGGLIVYRMSEASAMLKKYREFAKSLVDEMSVWFVLRLAPPLPFLPEDVHGEEILVFAGCYAGDPQAGMKYFDAVRAFGKPVGEHVGVMPYVGWQQVLDPLLTPGARNYWKSHNFASVSDGLIDTLIRYAGRLPSSQCEIAVAMVGGAMGRVKPEATAYAHRDANHIMNVHGRWDNAADDEKCIAWARDLYKDTAPFASGGVYVNFLTQEEGDKIKAAYGVNYNRLVELKKKYDPTNFFRVNQNIKA
jgi:FAD/FMN-containing dehydrogenase